MTCYRGFLATRHTNVGCEGSGVQDGPLPSRATCPGQKRAGEHGRLNAQRYVFSLEDVGIEEGAVDYQAGHREHSQAHSRLPTMGLSYLVPWDGKHSVHPVLHIREICV